MIQQRTPGKTAQLVFRIVAVTTLVAAFGQITLGGVVRVSGSGLGCPDWPLCHGRIIPPFQIDTMIEYAHRLSGSSLGILVIATTVMAWLFYRSKPWVMVSSVVALVMVVAAGILGGITVLTELVWWVRLIHLGIAEIVVSALVFALVAGWKVSDEATPGKVSLGETARLNRLILVTVIGTFVLLLSGSYMVGAGASSACGTWPLCHGELFPQSAAQAIHMGHRFFAAIVGGLIIWTAVAAMKRAVGNPLVVWIARILAIAFIVQILLGASVVFEGFSAQSKAIHLSAATAVWVALMFLAAMVYTTQGFELKRVGESPAQVAGSERLA